jgi:adenine phosphoribosyltransferase
MSIRRVKAAIRDIPDFPKPGILFKDITPVLADPELFKTAVNTIVARLRKMKVTKIAAVESRGFLFGAAAALRLGIGLVPIRKKGKLPYKTVNVSYELEYGSAELEMHRDAVTKKDRVVIIDDLLATGGTARAAAQLIEKLGAKVVELDFIIELSFLKGRDRLKGYKIFAPIVF